MLFREAAGITQGQGGERGRGEREEERKGERESLICSLVETEVAIHPDLL